MTTGLDQIDVFDPDLYVAGDPARNGLPFEQYAWLREHAPCVRVPCAIPGHEPQAWVVTRFDDVDATLRDSERYVSGYGVTMRASHTTVAGDEFHDPQDYRLDRAPNHHVTFAVGPHVCLGAHVARLELRVLFEELLRRTDAIAPDGPVEYARDSYLRGVKRLGVRV